MPWRLANAEYYWSKHIDDGDNHIYKRCLNILFEHQHDTDWSNHGSCWSKHINDSNPPSLSHPRAPAASPSPRPCPVPAGHDRHTDPCAPQHWHENNYHYRMCGNTKELISWTKAKTEQHVTDMCTAALQ
jgi:hypothetical protein